MQKTLRPLFRINFSFYPFFPLLPTSHPLMFWFLYIAFNISSSPLSFTLSCGKSDFFFCEVFENWNDFWRTPTLERWGDLSKVMLVNIPALWGFVCRQPYSAWFWVARSSTCTGYAERPLLRISSDISFKVCACVSFHVQSMGF